VFADISEQLPAPCESVDRVDKLTVEVLV